MKRKPLTDVYVMNYWLQKYHNISVEWLVENEPELIKTPDWYKKYAVTSTEHDEWLTWVYNEICKERKCSRKNAERSFCFDYWNVAPNVIETKTEIT